MRTEIRKCLGWDPCEVREPPAAGPAGFSSLAAVSTLSLASGLWDRVAAHGVRSELSLGTGTATESISPWLMVRIPSMHTRDLCLAELVLARVMP